MLDVVDDESQEKGIKEASNEYKVGIGQTSVLPAA